MKKNPEETETVNGTEENTMLVRTPPLSLTPPKGEERTLHPYTKI